MRVAIIGGGIVGLTTAGFVQAGYFRNADITVLASDFDDTVSHVAAGIFRVGASFCGPNETVTRQWIKNSYEFYDALRKMDDASHAGVTDISGYIFANSSQDTVRNHWLEGVVPVYRRANEEEFELVNGNWKYGSYFSTLLTQSNLYLPWARRRLQLNGVTFKQRELSSLKELTNDYDIVINCTGLGARKLCDDRRLVSLRGQVLKVKAPWMKMFFYGELDTYVIPGFNGIVTLGGSRNFDSENIKLCPHESAAIRERCETLIPSLKNAEILRQEVGLRPHRDGGVRVGDGSRISNHSKAITIHNYGHGGYGVCMAPGTSITAVNAAVELHKSTSSKI
ncbi:D-aspartate oxidase [Trachymyrmex zeteki]|uniref:D-aspartate oxidase n=1 Tax=Mycetomoellerius zeteki TaxID=64791 RepID=A0A151WVA9_9HYME|nr:PREDICTED: D-aspartate oxidase-like [Trachymyrmex zeteki]XP_018308565.1 PREDICTED: D-aspartate oxidase-like [Trachymyrmex zeteki]XP_018308566.1 PREDICTED: D-aspartate oxidase-like [Trachymyrmex zeteki]KYQ51870.1 D-aspartate oxidase [Trachymyrmex zeteki]